MSLPELTSCKFFECFGYKTDLNRFTVCIAFIIEAKDDLTGLRLGLFAID